MNPTRHDALGRPTTTVVALEAIAPSQMSVLRGLFQFYEYDFSEIEPAIVGDDGRFHHLENAPFEHGYFIRVEGNLAGFALVDRKASRVVEGETVWWMEEFFVMRRHRREGVGEQAAHLVIERHPGVWEVTQTPNNVAATAFWRRVLAPFAYEELEFDDPKRGLRPLQRFSTS